MEKTFVNRLFDFLGVLDNFEINCTLMCDYAYYLLLCLFTAANFLLRRRIPECQCSISAGSPVI
jgi:hypothetical protein